MGAPVGNQNGNRNAPKRILTNAIRRRLVRDPNLADRIVQKLVDAATADPPQSWAHQLLWDRVDGKQVGDMDEAVTLNIKAIVIRGVEPTREAIEGEIVVPATLPSPDT